MMIRIALATLMVALLAGCGSGNEERCRKAVRNVYRLTSRHHGNTIQDEPAAIRSCRANSSSETIDCMIAAKSIEDLKTCGGVLDQEPAAPAPGTAPATPPAPAPNPAPSPE